MTMCYHPNAVLAIFRVSELIRNAVSISSSTPISHNLESNATPIATGFGIKRVRRRAMIPSRTPIPAGVMKVRYPAVNEIAYIPQRIGMKYTSKGWD